MVSDNSPRSTLDAPTEEGWQPWRDETPAALGDNGRWLDSIDDMQTTHNGLLSTTHYDRPMLQFPARWPAVFNESTVLKSFINKQLRGQRCRVFDQSTHEEAASIKGITLRPLHSFENAQKLANVLGWSIVKGFIVTQLSDDNEECYVGVRHWWNEHDGRWIDATPPYMPPFPGFEQRRLLVQSEKGEKHASTLTEHRRSAAILLSRRLIAGGALMLAKHLVENPPDQTPAGSDMDGQLSSLSASQCDAEPTLGPPLSEAASDKGMSRVITDSSKWSSFDANSKWDDPNLYVSVDDDAPAPSAASCAEANMRQAIQEAKSKALAEQEHNIEAQRTTQLMETARQIRGLGFQTMTADELTKCVPSLPLKALIFSFGHNLAAKADP